MASIIPKPNKVVVTLGELMLRLKSPGFERLFQSAVLEASFGGGEANVAASLANFGLFARFLTALPSNQIGNAAITCLKGFNLDTSFIVRKEGRMGIYFLETGSGPRPSQVIYDRAGALIASTSPTDFAWEKIFSDAQWFHITGITPALSQLAAELSITAVQAAKKAGLKVSCDLNYRAKLWKYGKTAPEIMRQLIPMIDVIIANEEDIQMSLGIKIDQKVGGQLDRNKFESMGKQVFTEFPNVECIGITLRESYSANHNDWSAICLAKHNSDINIFTSKKYTLTDIVDRVGGGDAFASGLIYGLISGMDTQNALEFAVAASALKHTIPGDMNRVSVAEVQQLLKGDASGRVQR